MAMSGGRDDGEPMIEMNVTPLIDVMLVLLIMFIITIPPQTHAVKVDLPVNNTPVAVQPDKNKITIDPTGQVAWNGTPGIWSHGRAASRALSPTFFLSRGERSGTSGSTPRCWVL